jgi:hypothetical protein
MDELKERLTRDIKKEFENMQYNLVNNEPESGNEMLSREDMEKENIDKLVRKKIGI